MPATTKAADLSNRLLPSFRRSLPASVIPTSLELSVQH
jgi:hypothetical protein